ncbi:hypothetical protein JW887_01580 [Candidatus Dojkabacteria bacterium]|nr:hypothetical protein [Candidatus Dojkabacteria bacterium]
MKKILVCYYSKSGNNKYLANKIAKDLKCDVEEINPVPKGLIPLLLMSFFKLGAGIRSMNHNPADYDLVILCSPIWTGQLISPVIGFIKKFKNDIKKLAFITMCGGGDEDKDTEYGYKSVFNRVKNLVGDKLVLTKALSIKLLEKNGKKFTDEELMKLKITDGIFKGEIKKRYDDVIKEIMKI